MTVLFSELLTEVKSLTRGISHWRQGERHLDWLMHPQRWPDSLVYNYNLHISIFHALCFQATFCIVGHPGNSHSRHQTALFPSVCVRGLFLFWPQCWSRGEDVASLSKLAALFCGAEEEKRRDLSVSIVQGSVCVCMQSVWNANIKACLKCLLISIKRE